MWIVYCNMDKGYLMDIVELLGYVASVLVAISLTMRSVLRLRVINLVGSICFTIYGLLIQAYPVAGVNGFIVVINCVYLYQMMRSKAYFTLLETSASDAYLRSFLEFYAADIRSFAPSFGLNTHARDQLSWFILRDMVPVGLFVAHQAGDGILHVDLDYVIPGYRDLQPARFLYREQSARFQGLGVAKLCATPETEAMRSYFGKLGFQADRDNQMCRLVRQSV